MESPSEETCFTCGMPCREGHRCLEERIVEAMRADVKRDVEANRDWDRRQDANAKLFAGTRRPEPLTDKWLADVIARLRSVELTSKQALDLIAVITTRTRS